jgi:hypothetical protein
MSIGLLLYRRQHIVRASSTINRLRRDPRRFNAFD